MAGMTRPPSRESLEAIRKLLGPGGWLDSADDRAPFETDFRRIHRGSTLLVALPGSTAQVAELVRLCATAGIGIVPQGGNTSYCGGATPRANGADIVLSLRRMRRIRSVDTANDAMTADAGCVLAELQDAAAAANRLLPMSLGSEGSCTLGGIISTNAGGTAVLRYGMMRALVLGLEVVLPDGTVLDQLTALRKDNTGYDLKQLFIGAEGTLGVVDGGQPEVVAAAGGIRDGHGSRRRARECRPAARPTARSARRRGHDLRIDAAHCARIRLSPCAGDARPVRAGA